MIQLLSYKGKARIQKKNCLGNLFIYSLMFSESCYAPDVLLDTEDIVVSKMSLYSNLMEFTLSAREIHSQFSSVTQSCPTL